MRIALPALAAYSTAVNDHIVKRRRDPHRPAPHAQFLRRGSAHTGIPDPPEESPPVRKSRAPDSTPSTSSDTAPVSVGSIVRQCGLDTTYTSYATVAGQGACPSAEASTGCPPHFLLVTMIVLRTLLPLQLETQCHRPMLPLHWLRLVPRRAVLRGLAPRSPPLLDFPRDPLLCRLTVVPHLSL